MASWRPVKVLGYWIDRGAAAGAVAVSGFAGGGGGGCDAWLVWAAPAIAAVARKSLRRGADLLMPGTSRIKRTTAAGIEKRLRRGASCASAAGGYVEMMTAAGFRPGEAAVTLICPGAPMDCTIARHIPWKHFRYLPW